MEKRITLFSFFIYLIIKKHVIKHYLEKRK